MAGIKNMVLDNFGAVICVLSFLAAVSIVVAFAWEDRKVHRGQPDPIDVELREMLRDEQGGAR